MCADTRAREVLKIPVATGHRTERATAAARARRAKVMAPHRATLESARSRYRACQSPIGGSYRTSKWRAGRRGEGRAADVQTTKDDAARSPPAPRGNRHDRRHVSCRLTIMQSVTRYTSRIRRGVRYLTITSWTTAVSNASHRAGEAAHSFPIPIPDSRHSVHSPTRLRSMPLPMSLTHESSVCQDLAQSRPRFQSGSVSDRAPRVLKPLLDEQHALARGYTRRHALLQSLPHACIPL